MTVADAIRRADELNALIDADVEALHEHDIAWADAEQEYRFAVADAWERCPRDDPGVRQNGDWPVKRREAWVAGQCADLRHARDMAESARTTLHASLQSRRQQLSALQTLVNAERSEREREDRATGPEHHPATSGEPTGPRDLLSPEQLADYLDIPVATIYLWRHKGTGPEGFRVGRHVRYRATEVQRWLETNRSGATS